LCYQQVQHSRELYHATGTVLPGETPAKGGLGRGHGGEHCAINGCSLVEHSTTLPYCLTWRDPSQGRPGERAWWRALCYQQVQLSRALHHATGTVLPGETPAKGGLGRGHGGEHHAISRCSIVMHSTTLPVLSYLARPQPREAWGEGMVESIVLSAGAA